MQASRQLSRSAWGLDLGSHAPAGPAPTPLQQPSPQRTPKGGGVQVLDEADGAPAGAQHHHTASGGQVRRASKAAPGTGASLEQQQRRRAAAAAHRVFLGMGSAGAAGGAATPTLPLAPVSLPLLLRQEGGAARHLGRAARSGAARRSSGGGGTAATAGGWARHGLAATGTVRRALARMLRRLASLADAEHTLLRLGSREQTGAGLIADREACGVRS